MPSTQIAILAGGQSRRMGTDKAFVQLDGKPLLQHVIDRTSELGLPIILIANEIEKYKVFGVPVFSDSIPNAGSLGGLYTALQKSEADQTLCVACDMPFLNIKLLAYLIEQCFNYDAVVPVAEGRANGLHAVYSKACLPIMHTQIIEGNLAIRHVFSQVQTFFVTEEILRKYDVHLQSFVNLNTPTELDCHRGQSLKKSTV